MKLKKIDEIPKGLRKKKSSAKPILDDFEKKGWAFAYVDVEGERPLSAHGILQAYIRNHNLNDRFGVSIRTIEGQKEVFLYRK